MRQVGVRELNQNTSQVIERVRCGETLEVTDRGRPVARLVPIDSRVSYLDFLVTEGRALAPTDRTDDQLSMPPMLGDPRVNSAEELARLRDDERW